VPVCGADAVHRIRRARWEGSPRSLQMTAGPHRDRMPTRPLIWSIQVAGISARTTIGGLLSPAGRINRPAMPFNNSSAGTARDIIEVGSGIRRGVWKIVHSRGFLSSGPGITAFVAPPRARFCRSMVTLRAMQGPARPG